MAQAQKHWVQAMLNEDTYTPFPYFYDVTGWSNPLLFNLRGGSSGAVLDPAAARVRPVADPGRPRPPADPPTVGLYQLDEGSSAIESAGWLRYLLDNVWRLPYRELDAAAIAAGGLKGTDVLLVPNGSETDAADALGPAGQQALADWVAAGGRYVGWQGGTRLAAALGITTATLAEPTSDIPGSLLRVRVDRGSPLGKDVGPFAWAFYAYDLVMRASDPAQVAVAYPPAASPDFFVSGFAAGAEELGGTAAVIDEPVGDGRAVLFSFEPNFRAFTDGTQRLLRNAGLRAGPRSGRPRPGPRPPPGPGRWPRPGPPPAGCRRWTGRSGSRWPPPGRPRRSGCCAATAPASRPAGPGARSTSWSPTRAAWPPTSTRSRPTWPGGCATGACRSGRSACARRWTAASAREARVAA